MNGFQVLLFPFPGAIEIAFSALQAATKRHPTGNEAATKAQPNCNEPATKAHPSAMTGRDHCGLSGTMSDNDDHAEGFGARDSGRKGMQVSAGSPLSARDIPGKFLDTAPGRL